MSKILWNIKEKFDYAYKDLLHLLSRKEMEELSHTYNNTVKNS